MIDKYADNMDENLEKMREDAEKNWKKNRRAEPSVHEQKELKPKKRGKKSNNKVGDQNIEMDLVVENLDESFEVNGHENKSESVIADADYSDDDVPFDLTPPKEIDQKMVSEMIKQRIINMTPGAMPAKVVIPPPIDEVRQDNLQEKGFFFNA
jgi:hypothetical protein